MKCKLICAVLAIGGVLLFRPETARAAPMLCSGEFKTCISNCPRIADRNIVSACINGCHARQSMCMRTGCWQGATNRYCGLLRQ
jgi:hypothetical protein